MRILVLSGMHPLPTNVARGTFVADHVRLLRDANHDVRVVNPLPRMLQYQESRRSTLAGVAKAPAKHAFDGAEVLVPRYWGLSNQASAWLTASSIRRRTSAVQRWLGDWTPEAVVGCTPSGRLVAWPWPWRRDGRCRALAWCTAGIWTSALGTGTWGLGCDG